MLKDFFSIRLNLLKATIVDTFKNETAYALNNIASVFSTTFYNITYLLFINVLFSNTQTIAGYSYNEVLLFYFFCEIGAYMNALFNLTNADMLIQAVNTGELDLILTKPIPSLFYVSVRRINIVAFLRDAILPLLIVSSLIKWNQFNITPANLFVTLIVLIIGIICTHSILIIACLPVFWLGESSSILSFMTELWFGAGATVPLEGMEKALKKVVVIFLPSLLTAGVTTSILLNKSEPLPWVLVVIVCLVLFQGSEQFLWKKALKAYTSASS